ncbi:anti-sigma factor family protein [Microvirga makkahensis]|uniref:Anti-sigma factor n=1 Tax=Microvirga makkahensis TaxID=1128670 RepID=A0A7X3MNQ6_9HYPH|nr:hypothetical protein [Microvirga makkahensis]MXQ10419.1 hypothetical protein [Microvirga makkahensis]
MAHVHFSDEVLMAFADGELDEPTAAAVEQAIAEDPAIAGRVAGFLRSRRLIRSAFPKEAASDVPPELLAAVQAQIERFEGPSRQRPPSPLPSPSQSPLQALRRAPPDGRWRFGIALAASLAALAIAAAAYLAGRQGLSSPSSDPIAHLADPEVRRVLSESPSGQERSLSFGRMRMISTFRMANGNLCREFKIEARSATSDAVACHDGDWTITFALASAAADAAYVPSGESDLMASYLQNSGAGEPLVDDAETRALNEARRRR